MALEHGGPVDAEYFKKASSSADHVGMWSSTLSDRKKIILLDVGMKVAAVSNK